MLTSKEIKQIVDAHQEVFVTKTDFVILQDEMNFELRNALLSLRAPQQVRGKLHEAISFHIA
ncbi:MAG: hypothetical protein A3H64_00960 [Candidatus Ryanbacteria bacterium RIFCSPLOWO2_02_FULL_45_11c]|uniref:Uncharacterized protein n=1 Tax=Candidatus Ryanbacteria bacterium RIFCSPLOWO2_02_FULL_45_11c TaxID=1802128 RepID=A0A1G2H253_9BACT|nr:MAG: hypothetical protein A3H64_00960 [Candidatus Ryanbacteria bacterium RIFCSPLOWO2_02_FULL_45_11c]